MVAATVGVVVAPATPAQAATEPSRPIVIAGTTWQVRDTLTGPATTTFNYGNPGDVPISGDWDGDGAETPGVVRGRTWYLRNSLSAGPPDVTFTYGRSTDAIVVGDWDGNGTDTPGIVRSNTWHLRNSNTSGGGEISYIYGATYDTPLAGDWDGDGTTTPGAIRGNTWILRNSNSAGQGDLRFVYGAVTDLKVAGDWDGNGTATVGAVRDGQWILRNSNTPGAGDVTFSYGNAGDLPLSTTQAFARDRGGRPLSSSRRGNHMTALPTTAKVVALTFDAGANNNGVASILSTLAAQGVPATFFMTGAFTRTFPNDARTIGLRYPVGNHSDTHPDFRTLTDAQIRTQLSTAQSAIANSARYDPRPLFRFPYGGSNTRTLTTVNGAGYASIWWTVDTLGWQGTSGGQSASTVVSRVVNALRPGEIVLMHMGSNPTDGSTLDADALPTIISELRARGYSFTTLVPYL
jgi:peptidoglycan/xylan/chitin deacetylase (PgdA/CDA1 family)